MAFKFFKWLLQPTGETEDGKEPKKAQGAFLDETPADITLGTENYLQLLAFWSCVRRIGSAVGAVEWETYRRGKKVRAREYWSWNYSPNPNQNRAQFFNDLISRLFVRGEALIAETRDGSRYVADGFTVDRHLSGDIYRGISSGGEDIPGVFSASEVIYLNLDSTGLNLRSYISAASALTGRLLNSAVRAYVRNNGRHGKLEIADVAESDEDFNEIYDELMQKHFKKYFEAENAVLPLYKGYQYTEDQSAGSSAGAASTTRDIRSIMDDVYEQTAMGLGLPVSIATGKNLTKEDFENFLTSPVQPIVRMIAQEINRKVYGPQLVGNGSYVAPNFAAVKYHDVFDIADPIDKLIGSGAFCINDILVLLGRDPIDEPWAWQHWMTKNYSPADELVAGLNSNTTSANSPGKEENNA